jgi:hypothetical protein
MACNVYSNQNLFKTPAYSFNVIFSKDKFKRIRLSEGQKEFNNDSGNINDVFLSVYPDISLCSYKKLNTIDDIIESIEKKSNLITTIYNEKELLTFPVKHINFKRTLNKTFQIETGPIVFNLENFLNIESATIGYVAFNSFNTYELMGLDSRTPSGFYNSIEKFQGEISVYAKE